jgi:hypothetical protein
MALASREALATTQPAALGAVPEAKAAVPEAPVVTLANPAKPLKVPVLVVAAAAY